MAEGSQLGLGKPPLQKPLGFKWRVVDILVFEKDEVLFVATIFSFAFFVSLFSWKIPHCLYIFLL
jgi:hypothetical protein